MILASGCAKIAKRPKPMMEVSQGESPKNIPFYVSVKIEKGLQLKRYKHRTEELAKCCDDNVCRTDTKGRAESPDIGKVKLIPGGKERGARRNPV